MYQLISETEPRARKKYLCIWCGQAILKGEKHTHEVSNYDGDLQDHRWHMECIAAAQEYFRTERCEEFDPYENERPSKPIDLEEDQRSAAQKQAIINRFKGKSS